MFDLDWYGSDVPAKQCFAVAYEEELTPGEYIEVDLALHVAWAQELNRQERDQHRGDAQEMAEVGPNPHSHPRCDGATVVRLGAGV